MLPRRAIPRSSSIPTPGGSNGGWSRACSSTSVMPRPPTSSPPATPPNRRRCAPKPNSTAAGTRSSSCTIRRRRSSISPTSRRSPACRSPSRAPNIGSAAPRWRQTIAGEAAHHFRNAGAYPTTFYGQLALARLGSKRLTLTRAAGRRTPPSRPASLRASWSR